MISDNETPEEREKRLSSLPADLRDRINSIGSKYLSPTTDTSGCVLVGRETCIGDSNYCPPGNNSSERATIRGRSI